MNPLAPVTSADCVALEFMNARPLVQKTKSTGALQSKLERGELAAHAGLRRLTRLGSWGLHIRKSADGGRLTDHDWTGGVRSVDRADARPHGATVHNSDCA
jgi:hypothetical protein